MTTSKHSQLTLFEDGSNERTPKLGPLWPTPAANDDNKSPEAHMAMKARMLGGPRSTVTSLQVATKAGIEPSTSSLEDFRANHSLSPGSDWARKMTVHSGTRCSGLSAISGPAGCLVKILLESSVWASTTCYLTWKRSATPAGRLLFRLQVSTPRTGATGFGLWPTPAKADGERGSLTYCRGNPTLKGAANLWPTPRTEGFDAGRHRGNPDSLHAAVKLLPTPQHHDYKTGTGYDHTDNPHTPQLRDLSGGKLSAAWVSRLQGYPDGWLDLES